MKKNYQKAGWNRRQFLQTGAKISASALLLSYGGSKLYGATGAVTRETGITPVKLNNGENMPILGFGTYDLREAVCRRCVADAISYGYRLFDTATIYGNEEFVGAGIRDSGIDRRELFITSKVWVDDSGYENTKKAFELSLNKLGTDYLDLYLIHRPRGDVDGTWKAMEDLYREGRIKSIGVSNFEPGQLQDLMTKFDIPPAVNQIETHAFFQQFESYSVLKDKGIQMEAWAPFAEGRNGLFTNDTLAEVGNKYNKTNAQVSLRWHYQRGIVAIPRTSQKVHMKENLDIFDFELTPSDMKTIARLDLNKTQFPEWN